MKHGKSGVFTLLIVGMVIALTCIAGADQVVPAVPETQTLGTVTTADVVGLVTETDAGTWTLTNDPYHVIILTNQGIDPWTSPPLDVAQQLIANGGSFALDGSGNISQFVIPVSLLNTLVAGYNDWTWSGLISDFEESGYSEAQNTGGIHTGALDPGQVQYTTAYDAGIVAQAGHTSFAKSMSIDTRNKVIGQSNLNAQTALTYIATADGGNVVGWENLMIDGAGNTTSASDRMLCPFSSQPVDLIPAYCNIVQAGSTYDLTVGSVTTNANDRFIGNDATNPVVLNYAINVKPYGTSQGQIPASGSAMAYVKAHIQEARNYNNGTITFIPFDGETPVSLGVPSTPLKVEDLTYSESSSAQGTITSFNKVIAYQSGKALL